ncbi:MAG: YraN family protein [Pseudomonadota bacterium]
MSFVMRVSMPSDRRRTRGHRNAMAGLMAEEGVARAYESDGAEILARRCRMQGGELDIVAREGDVLVFVEVKRRRAGLGGDCPVGARQWRRLETAAEEYMLRHAQQTGVVPRCRFDLAVTGPDGVSAVIINACSAEQY